LAAQLDFGRGIPDRRSEDASTGYAVLVDGRGANNGEGKGLVGAKECEERVADDERVGAENGLGIDIITLLGIDFRVAANTFQALGRLGLKVRIDDNAADALFVYPFTVNVQIVVGVDATTRRKRKLRNFV
jgi:hypothetical protein